MRPVKEKTYQEQTFALRIPLELDDDDLDLLKMERLSWLRLLGEVLRIAPPYSTMGETLFRHIFTHPWLPYGRQASSTWTLRYGSTWTCTSTWSSLNHFFYLHNDDVLKVHMRAHSIFFFKTCLPWAQIPLDQSSDHSLNNTLVNPWSSSLSSPFCLETNIWSSSITYGQILQV